MPPDYDCMGRIERIEARRAHRSAIWFMVSKRDAAFLKELALDEHLTMQDFLRSAVNVYLRGRGMPDLDEIHRERCDKRWVYPRPFPLFQKKVQP